MKVLLAKRRALGDTVLLSSTVEMLAARGAEIYVIVPRAFAPVLEGNPHIKKIFFYEEGVLSLIRQVRRLKLDYFFRLHAPPRKTMIARFSGAKKIVYHVHSKATEAAYGKHPDALEWDSFLLKTEIDSSFPQKGPEPKIYLSASEISQAKEFWQQYGVTGSQVVLFGLGASRPTKRWPAKYFARLAELLKERMDLVPVVITGPGEEEEKFSGQVIDQMRALGMRPKAGKGKGDFLHLAGLSVRKLAQVSSAAKFYVGNDSGPKHIALASGIPTFTFFGPEDPVEWHPYSFEKHPVFFEAGLSCRKEDGGRWCGIPFCTLERHRCMEDLLPEDAAITIQNYFGGVNA